MKLTTRSEYALLALISLARHDSSENVSGETIAGEQGIPQNYLRQILLTMNRAGYVQSTKGQHGGYRLARLPEEIVVADIVRLFDGAIAPTDSVSRFFYEPTPIEKEKKLLGLFQEIRDLVAAKLENTTLADVI